MIKLLVGDFRDRAAEIPAGSVHAVVTSPPYFGLRDYGVAGQLGLEETPDAYVVAMVEVFREVRRVLRRDGTVWLNMGDGYASQWCGDKTASTSTLTKPNGRPRRVQIAQTAARRRGRRFPGCKRKDLLGMPWWLAFALRADGWYLRDAVVWAKPNPMPGSQRDRCTSSYEFVFQLAKSPRPFFDWYAIAEPTSGTAHPRGAGVHPRARTSTDGVKANASYSASVRHLEEIRFARNIWTVETDPTDWEYCAGCGAFYKGAERRSIRVGVLDGVRTAWCRCGRHDAWTGHFATMPREIARRCVAAATSEFGTCPSCRAPWRRVVTRVAPVDSRVPRGWDTGPGHHKGLVGNYKPAHERLESAANARDLMRTRPESRAADGRGSWRHDGWEPTCACGRSAAPVPAVVLDPFGGAGTTGLVAQRLGRDAVLVELRREYAEMAAQRITHDAPMFSRCALS